MDRFTENFIYNLRWLKRRSHLDALLYDHEDKFNRLVRTPEYREYAAFEMVQLLEYFDSMFLNMYDFESRLIDYPRHKCHIDDLINNILQNLNNILSHENNDYGNKLRELLNLFNISFDKYKTLFFEHKGNYLPSYLYESRL